MPRLLLVISLFAAALLLGAALASCDGASALDELPPTPPTDGTLPIGFSTRVEGAAETRGSLATADLRSMSVFAYYTGADDWVATTHKPNFMFNQKVTRTGSNVPWTYSPVKYWPNNQNDKLSFFAFAPAMADVPGLSMSTTNTTTGYPILKYRVPTTATSQTDLLMAMPLMNRTQSNTAISFQMKHVLTRILVKAKCTEAITMNSVQLNEAYAEAKFAFNDSGTNCFEIADNSVEFNHNVATTVPANTETQVAEFFMVPATGKSLTINFTYSGTTETKTVTLPSTPTWTKGTSVAYTLNIEVGSKVTLTAKSWDTNSTTGNMGQDVPTGTEYPYTMNGVVYESATKSYYVGEGIIKTFPGSANEPGWYTWYEMVNICKNLYTSGPYAKREWRLPTSNELVNIRNLTDLYTGKTPAPGTTYWSSTEVNESVAVAVNGYDGFANPHNKGKTESNCRSLCIRDMGEITVYPTLRQTKDGYHIAYIDASTKIRIHFEYNTMEDNKNYGYRQYSSAENRCTNLRSGGYSDWKLPEKADIEKLIEHVDFLKGHVVWTKTPHNGSTTAVWAWHHTYNWTNYLKSDEAYWAIAPCVRNF